MAIGVYVLSFGGSAWLEMVGNDTWWSGTAGWGTRAASRKSTSGGSCSPKAAGGTG